MFGEHVPCIKNIVLRCLSSEHTEAYRGGGVLSSSSPLNMVLLLPKFMASQGAPDKDAVLQREPRASGIACDGH